MPDTTDLLLGRLLQRVSRSFYLSLRVLPDGMRVPVSLAYLIARAADTIADTPGSPARERLDRLRVLRALVTGEADPALAGTLGAAAAGQDASEAALLAALPEALDLLRRLAEVDAAAIRQVVLTLMDGMGFDLQRFEHGTAAAPQALQTLQELDRYTYLVAGCVGEFWTDVALRHAPELAGWSRDARAAQGIAYGKALQMTNVLRDVAQDLANGRCYLPLALLSQHGLSVRDLGDAARRDDCRPLLAALSGVALSGFREAAGYVLALPVRSLRLRLASLWPLMLGLASLELLLASPGWLDPAVRLKVPRAAVYRMLLRSLPTVLSNAALRRWMDAALRRATAALASGRG